MRRNAALLSNPTKRQNKQTIHQQQMQAQLSELEEKLKNINEQKEAALSHYNEAKSALENISDEKLLASNRDGFQFYLDNLHLLTKKEKDILWLYPSDMSFKEMAQQLGITENTLKYHNKNIYSKLGLKSRKEAVQFIRLEKKYHNPET